MKKVLVIPDSFKGTLSSAQVSEITAGCIKAHFPDAAVSALPVADGGEGSVDSFLAAVGGEKSFVTVKGPFMKDMECYYGLIDEGKTAVIEMAACSGLPLVGERLEPDKTTTYGVGQIISDAVKKGCDKIILCIGGSATNDLGMGAAAALGIRFLDENGHDFIPVGGTISKIRRIDTSGLLPRLREIEIVTMCDIDNPLYGPNGAAYIFGPQKGADAEMVKFLDAQLRHGADIIQKDLGVDIRDISGSGAAGGMGGGMIAFLGSSVQMGIETILNAINFDSLVEGADLVITGEGRIDSQSLRGKVVIGVARRAMRYNVPVIAVVGAIGDDIDPIYDEGVTAVFSINRAAVDFSESRHSSAENLALTVDNLIRFWKAARK